MRGMSGKISKSAIFVKKGGCHRFRSVGVEFVAGEGDLLTVEFKVGQHRVFSVWRREIDRAGESAVGGVEVDDVLIAAGFADGDCAGAAGGEVGPVARRG